MKRKNLFVAIAILVIVTLGCKKDSPTGTQNPSSFPSNTVWVGTQQPLARQFDQPCCLKFNSDKTVKAYSLFNILQGNDVVHYDSLKGNIMKLENIGNDIVIDIDFPEIQETQKVTIRNKTSLITQGAVDAGKPNFFVMNLSLFPEKEFPVANTGWSGKVMHGGPVEGMYAYPDLSSIKFEADKSTTYYRNGKIAVMTVNGEYSYTFKSVYKQEGPMVFMNGFNETKSNFVYYFGVLQPSGDAMWIDSRDNIDGRLPNYVQTIEWYGPKGVTPVIYKL